MYMRTNVLLAAALLVGMGLSGTVWAGNVCQMSLGSSNNTTNPDDGTSTACGIGNHASGYLAFAFGFHNTASGHSSNAFGSGGQFPFLYNTASGDFSNAFGYANLAEGSYSSAFGALSKTGDGADYSIAFGAGAQKNLFDPHSGSAGAVVADGATSAIAIGHTVSVNASDSVAIGHNTTVAAGATGAVALGSGSIADAANTISVGASGAERRIVNVAAGNLSATSADAVNGGQLYTTNQGVQANAVSINTNTGSIATNTTAIDTLNNMAVFYANTAHTQIAFGTAGTPVVLSNVAEGTAPTDAVNKAQLNAVAAQASQTAADAVTYHGAGKTGITLAGNGGTTISNVKAGTLSVTSTEAVNGGQLHATNQNVATNTTHMAINAADAQGNGRLAVGVGFASGKSALSVGYGAPLGKRLHISFGATASGSEASAGIGFGVDL